MGFFHRSLHPDKLIVYVVIAFLVGFGVEYAVTFLTERLTSLYSSYNDTLPEDYHYLIYFTRNNFLILAAIMIIGDLFLPLFVPSFLKRLFVLSLRIRILLVICMVLFIIITPFTGTYQEWHLNRNKYNVLPSGKLVPKTNASPDYVYNSASDNLYVDNSGLEWKLLPGYLSVEHQPEKHELCNYPYPNKKFVHRHGVGSSELILEAPDWAPIPKGNLQESFNYVDPSGILMGLYCEPQVILRNVDIKDRVTGTLRDLGHLIVDMIPHYIANDFLSKSYKPTNR